MNCESLSREIDRNSIRKPAFKQPTTLNEEEALLTARLRLCESPDNSLGDDGVKALLPALVEMKGLKTLDLRSKCIPD